MARNNEAWHAKHSISTLASADLREQFQQVELRMASHPCSCEPLTTMGPSDGQSGFTFQNVVLVDRLKPQVDHQLHAICVQQLMRAKQPVGQMPCGSEGQHV